MPEPNQTPFQKYLSARKRYAHTTLDAYQADVDRFLAHLDRKGIPTAETNPATVTAYLRRRRGASYNRTLRSLNLYFAYCADSDLLPGDNPAANLKRRRSRAAPRPQLTTQELFNLEATAFRRTSYGNPHVPSELGSRELGMLALFAHCGLSYRQAAMLTAADLMFDSAPLRLRRVGFGGAVTYLDIPEPVAQLLWELRGMASDAQRALGREHEATLLLVSLRGPTRGQALTAQATRHALQRLATAAGVSKPVTPTSLRRLAQSQDTISVAQALYDWIRNR